MNHEGKRGRHFLAAVVVGGSQRGHTKQDESGSEIIWLWMKPSVSGRREGAGRGACCRAGDGDGFRRTHKDGVKIRPEAGRFAMLAARRYSMPVQELPLPA